MIGVSSCLAGIKCRYDGKDNAIDEIVELVKNNQAITICPEVLGGMSTPRIPCERRNDKVINQIGQDQTKAFEKGAKLAYQILQENNIQTVILKAKSPSCGSGLIYDGTFSKKIVVGDGIASAYFKERGIMVYDESQINQIRKEDKTMGTILWMNPVFKEMIWGGTKLRDVYGYDIPSDQTGECWAISAHKNGDCVINEGKYAGKTLSSLWQNQRQLFGNITGDQFPLLVKIIDANNDLSVQVHPDDEYAAKNENSLGKEECWYVLDADENTQMVMGHHAKTKEELVESINNADYDQLLNRFKVNKGDFFNIPTGTIHAICSGSLIYEAQQSSDITYRVYDYNRTDAAGNQRELHVQQSIDVTNVPYVPYVLNQGDQTQLDNGSCQVMVSGKFFTVEKYEITGQNTLQNDQPFLMVSVIEGNGIIDGKTVQAGSHCLVCSDMKTFDVDGNMTVMVAHL